MTIKRPSGLPSAHLINISIDRSSLSSQAEVKSKVRASKTSADTTEVHEEQAYLKGQAIYANLSGVTSSTSALKSSCDF